MSYCRTTLVEFNSEKLADEASADYSKNASSEFPEAEILLFTRTGPTSAIVASVYPMKTSLRKQLRQEMPEWTKLHTEGKAQKCIKEKLF